MNGWYYQELFEVIDFENFINVFNQFLSFKLLFLQIN